MIFFGHKFLKNEPLYLVSSITDIEKTPPSSLILCPFSESNIAIMEHCATNGVRFATKASALNEILYSSSLGASFIVVPKKLAQTAHNCAQNYLFDAKILVEIDDDNEIEKLAILGVDGVIYSHAIVQL